jgi:hypothetical protein
MSQPVPNQVSAAFITPECRAGRGVDGAWDEAVARLRSEYDAVLAGWSDHDDEVTLNLVLTFERP